MSLSFESIAEDRGWTLATQIDVLLGYIENQCSDDVFSDYLKGVVDEENSLTG